MLAAVGNRPLAPVLCCGAGGAALHGASGFGMQSYSSLLPWFEQCRIPLSTWVQSNPCVVRILSVGADLSPWISSRF